MEQNRMRVLLADDNKEFCEIVAIYLQKEPDMEVIAVAHNGADAYDKIVAHKPDVAILDGAMPELDGIGILEKLRNSEHRPVCIMLSGIKNENVTKRAFELGAEYYIIKPFDLTTLADRIRMFKNNSPYGEENGWSRKSSHKSAPRNLEQSVTNFVHEIGIPAHIRGYNYIRVAVILAIDNPELLYYVTKELYPAVAKKCDTTPVCVERAIRHGIHKAWNINGREKLERLIGGAVTNIKKKPTNGEFISLIADKFRLENSG